MNTKVLFGAVLTVTLLVGCATKPTVGGESEMANRDCPDSLNPRDEICGLNRCAIPVQLVYNAQDQKCEVVVGAPVMRIAKGNHGADGQGVILFWWLPLNSKWEFRAESAPPPVPFAAPIIFKGPTATQAPTQFVELTVGPNRGRSGHRQEHRQCPI